MSEQFTHPSIGQIKGRTDGNVIQFHGVPYASLENRFASPVLCDKYNSDSILDATKVGPSPVSPTSGCDNEYMFIQHKLEREPDVMSETECLHLNITIPSRKSSEPLPVFVFIYGGGFAVGSNSWPQYDFARLVELSIETSMPIIAVAVNYRLGAFGFLTSKELQQAGFKSNNGLRDQRTALLWIQKYIAGFGGDPDNVTIMGESAGGAACTMHLQSKEPLFKRLVAMGGNALAIKALPPIVSELAYEATLKDLNIAQHSPKERVAALLQIPAKDFLTKLVSGFPLLPVIDGELIKDNYSFAQFEEKNLSSIAGSKWCESIMVGECQFDASIFAYMVAAREAGCAGAFRASVNNTLSASHADQIEPLLSAYNINSNIPDSEVFINIMRFVQDIAFYASSLVIAIGWKEGFSYRFNQPNPWPGRFTGESTHILDITFLFQNFNAYLTSSEREIAKTFATHFLTFVNGKRPYPPISDKEGGAMVYGPPVKHAEFVTGSDPEAYGRKNTIWNFAKHIPLDTLIAVWDNYLAGR